MEKRKISSLNVNVSLLGFGLMRLPILGGDREKVDYPKAQAMVDRAIKAGVNYFDTAYVYHNGASEIFAGDTLSKYPRDSYYLATKMPPWLVNSKEDVARVFDEQLKRCKTTYFDFYLAHSLSADRFDSLKNNVYDFLLKKKEEGIIRRLGFSFHDHPSSIKELLKNYKWDFAQIQINYLDWETLNAKSLYETLIESNMPILVMEPVKGGGLARLQDTTLAVLKKANPSASAASWALRFAASLPGVVTVLSGMTEPEHVEDNLKTFENFKPLSEAEKQVLVEAAKIYHSSGTIPCTACRYCMDCPSGVDIPRVFAQYNYYLLGKNKIGFLNGYKTLAQSEQAHNCVNCGKCVKLCPQQIDIPGILKDVAATAAS